MLRENIFIKLLFYNSQKIEKHAYLFISLFGQDGWLVGQLDFTEKYDIQALPKEVICSRAALNPENRLQSEPIIAQVKGLKFKPKQRRMARNKFAKPIFSCFRPSGRQGKKYTYFCLGFRDKFRQERSSENRFFPASV